MSIGIPLKNCFSLIKAHPFIKVNNPSKDVYYNYINNYINYLNEKEHEKIFNLSNFSSNINIKSLIRVTPKNKKYYIDFDNTKTNNYYPNKLLNSPLSVKYKQNDFYSKKEKVQVKPKLTKKVKEEINLSELKKENYREEFDEDKMGLIENYHYLSSNFRGNNKENYLINKEKNKNNNQIIPSINSNPNISYNSCSNSLININSLNYNKSNKKGNLTQSTIYSYRINSPPSNYISPCLSIKDDQIEILTNRSNKLSSNYRYSSENENKNKIIKINKRLCISSRGTKYIMANRKKNEFFPLMEKEGRNKGDKLIKSLFGDSNIKKQYLKFVESKSLTLRANIIFNRIQNNRGGKQEIRSSYDPFNV